MSLRSQPQWLVFAIASGGCAALNGVFAKLTTTQLTTQWAAAISRWAGLPGESSMWEFVVRGFFFLMNLAFNAVMWGLFTRALTLASSTVRVSVVNTSANFMLTALLGALVFSEALPALWWLGASMLVAGSVMIGRREQSTETGGAAAGAAPGAVVVPQDYTDEPDAPPPGVGRLKARAAARDAGSDGDEIELHTTGAARGEGERSR